MENQEQQPAERNTKSGGQFLKARAASEYNRAADGPISS